MKKLTLLLCLMLLLSACAKTPAKEPEPPNSEPAADSKDESRADSKDPDNSAVVQPTAGPINVDENGKEYTIKDLTQPITDFSFRWLAQDTVLKDIEAGKNVMLSPFSLYEDMSMLANGASGETLDEILKTFGASSNAQLNGITTFDGGDDLTISNSIWVKDTMGDLNQEYISRIEPYQAGVFSRPFDDTTKDEVNQWVSEKTNGMIPEFLKQMNQDAVMLLFNAVCFEGKWQLPYEDYQIAEGEKFTNARGEKEQATMLMSGYECTYFSLNEADCAVKMYEGDKLAFVAIRPKDGQTVAEFLSGLTGEDFLAAYRTAYHPDELDVRIPEFSYDYDISASEDMQKMGIEKAFTDDAEFSGLLESGTPLKISSIVQKTHIELDRTGTKAAAVTEIEMEECAMEEPEDIDRKEVILDRPFVYAIVESESGLPIFIGAVNTVQP